ncbi:uncharacterized protein SAPINGB_P004496 [Magnusiomyces paraingens]|uniref:Beta-lactamase-related domain-containing protein n=1 Tax=Magnusiomyces paraingens TaxID=2606893 RepID=A0A5E8BU38_9ASCO|nr:uncharacterized protein SAPINGB_P004496 [Saprochaete ingens]VVT55238.1 unnamed protein product [Saprochaete ingens]
MSTLSAESVNEIKQLAADATKDPITNIPGVSIAVINKNGDLLVEHAAGKIGVNSDEPMTTDNTFWIASCTKVSATIVALQAVEKGIVSLDSADDVEKWCPELANIPIIKDITNDGTVTLVPKSTRITLRMLLSHTSGFSYTFFNKNYNEYAKLFGLDELNGGPGCVNKFPLAFEPGTNWGYGVGIDWAVDVVSRASGKSFQHLLSEGIFQPLGFTLVSTTPCDAIKSRLVKLHQRDLDTGKLSEIPQSMKWPLSDKPDLAAQAYQSGGAGIFAKPSEYVRIFSALLNGGVYAPTGARLLREETVKLMFENQIPQWPDFARQGIQTTQPLVSHTLPEIFPQEGNPPQGWGLSFFLTPTETPYGRGKNTAFWCGIANLYYWIDVEKGVAGFVAAQLYPFADPQVLKLWIDVEVATYKGLTVA